MRISLRTQQVLCDGRWQEGQIPIEADCGSKTWWLMPRVSKEKAKDRDEEEEEEEEGVGRRILGWVETAIGFLVSAETHKGHQEAQAEEEDEDEDETKTKTKTTRD